MGKIDYYKKASESAPKVTRDTWMESQTRVSPSTKKDPNRTRTGTTPGGRKYVSMGFKSGNRLTTVTGKGNAVVHHKGVGGKFKDVGTSNVRTSPIKKSFTKKVKK